MKLRLQLCGGRLAVGLSAAMALPSAAKNHNNRPPTPQPEPHPPRQTNRPTQQPGGRPQNKPPKNDGPHHNATPNRPSPYQQTESMGMIGGDRPQNLAGESRRQPNFNPNRPPKADNRMRNFSPEERQKLDRKSTRLNSSH